MYEFFFYNSIYKALSRLRFKNISNQLITTHRSSIGSGGSCSSA